MQQPSQLEIQREVEALRNLRRRSTTQGGPGALILDPDLPNSSPPSSPTNGYWQNGSGASHGDVDTAGASYDGSSSPDRTASPGDPFHLFWVPARLHPEIAPAEFRAFLKEHARDSPTETDEVVRPARSSSLNAHSHLGRKRSRLSRQFKPSDTEESDDEKEKATPLRRGRTLAPNVVPQLTIDDLQKLEQLAEEAGTTGDPTKFRNVLRRSMSLNVSSSVEDKVPSASGTSDEADVPITVPPPGSILRRAARTKIRKPSLQGDAGGHRFGPGRRPRATPTMEPRSSSDLSSNDHTTSEHDYAESNESLQRPRAFSMDSSQDDHFSHRPQSFSEEASIYDAYVRDSEEPRPKTSTGPPQLPAILLPSDDGSETLFEEPKSETSASGPSLEHPQPQRLTVSPTSEEESRTPSPDTSTLNHSTEDTATLATSSESAVPPSKTPSPAKREKSKKLFAKWSSDKSTKKKEKEKEKEKESQPPVKDKETGFFGSLFGGKKKHDDQKDQSSQHGPGREAGYPMPGAANAQSLSPTPQMGGMQSTYARYPIHVERAIYRLSHIKLANPRRPLYEQVLISNLMFWYLGVINKTQAPANTPQTQPAGQQQTNTPNGEGITLEQREDEEQGGSGGNPDEIRGDHEMEAEKQRELELGREREEKEREREREREAQTQKKESSRRPGLTKASGGPNRRVAEMPVKGPQYDMQHREMEQEYGYGYGSSTSTPISSPRSQRQAQLNSSYGQTNNFSHSGYGDQQQQLPPGAMAPASVANSASPRRTSSSPPPDLQVTSSQARTPGRSRSPPGQNHNRYSPSQPLARSSSGSRTPTRSLSAAASSTGVPLSADGKARKVHSAHAVMASPNGRSRVSLDPGISPREARVSEEEDVPLAVWKEQRR